MKKMKMTKSAKVGKMTRMAGGGKVRFNTDLDKTFPPNGKYTKGPYTTTAKGKANMT